MDIIFHHYLSTNTERYDNLIKVREYETRASGVLTYHLLQSLHKISLRVCYFIIQRSLTFSLSRGLTGRPIEYRLMEKPVQKHCIYRQQYITRNISKVCDMTILPSATTNWNNLATFRLHTRVAGITSTTLTPHPSSLEFGRTSPTTSSNLDFWRHSGQAPEPLERVAHPYHVLRTIKSYVHISPYADG
jgi:hypothetical protein